MENKKRKKGAPIGNKNAVGHKQIENSKKTRFKKGQHPSPETEFKKGSVPWSKGKKGKLSPNWKGGFSLFNAEIRLSDKYKIWRSRVFERDNWTCQTCQKKGNIEAHHKKEFSKIIQENKIRTMIKAMNCKELWDVENGVTLCGDCHKLIRRKK